eukprot:1119448-Pelagomonas_calceolata.AAC.1
MTLRLANKGAWTAPPSHIGWIKLVRKDLWVHQAWLPIGYAVPVNIPTASRNDVLHPKQEGRKKNSWK